MDVLLRAQSLCRGGGLRQAAELLEMHMASDPGDLRVAAALGRVYRRLQQPEQAAQWLRHSLQRPCAPSELDDEDIEYFGEAVEAGVVFDMDHEYGVDTEVPKVADDDGSQGVIKPDRGFESEASVEEPSDQSSELPGLAQEKEPEDLGANEENALSFEELEHLQEDLAELFEEDNDEGGEDFDALYDGLEPNDVGQDDDLDELPGRLTQREKAEGVATEIAVEAGWLKNEVDILIEVLSHHRSHGKTRSALRDLLVEKDVTPSELEVLHDIRLLWGGGGYNRFYRNSKAEEGWPNVSWQLGLRLIRGLRVDSAEEALLFVDDCFEDWSESPKQLNTFPVFTNYLKFILAHMEGVSRKCGQVVPSYIEFDFFEGPDHDYEKWYEPRFRNGYMIVNVMPGKEDWRW